MQSRGSRDDDQRGAVAGEDGGQEWELGGLAFSNRRMLALGAVRDERISRSAGVLALGSVELYDALALARWGRPIRPTAPLTGCATESSRCGARARCRCRSRPTGVAALDRARRGESTPRSGASHPAHGWGLATSSDAVLRPGSQSRHRAPQRLATRVAWDQGRCGEHGGHKRVALHDPGTRPGSEHRRRVGVGVEFLRPGPGLGPKGPEAALAWPGSAGVCWGHGRTLATQDTATA